MREQIATLKKQEAVDSILASGQKTVFYQNGCWSPYKRLPVADVVARVQGCEFGADVSFEEETGDIYVTTPVSGDMW